MIHVCATVLFHIWKWHHLVKNWRPISLINVIPNLRPKLLQSVSSAIVWFQKEFVIIRAHSAPLSWEELFLIPSQVLIIAGRDWEYPHLKGNPRVCQWLSTLKIRVLHAFVFCPLFTKCIRVQQRLQLCNSVVLQRGGGKASCRILGSTYPFITLNNHSSGDLSCKV